MAKKKAYIAMVVDSSEEASFQVLTTTQYNKACQAEDVMAGIYTEEGPVGHEVSGLVEAMQYITEQNMQLAGELTGLAY